MPIRVRSMLDLKIPEANVEPRALKDFSTARVHFRDLPQKAAHLIRQYDYVLGCVAWLTHPLILDALATCRGVSMLVQKEDFLRPDGDTWRQSLREQYDRVPGGERYWLPGVAGEMSACADPTFEAIRCVGNHNRDRRPAHPRSHHKFMVLCKKAKGPAPQGVRKDCAKCDALRSEKKNAGSGSLFLHFLWCSDCLAGQRIRSKWEARAPVPHLVWTGSFNFTRNSGESFENVVLLDDAESCNAYLQEWAQIFALSEPLDWASDWCAPEWRIGS